MFRAIFCFVVAVLAFVRPGAAAAQDDNNLGPDGKPKARL